MAIHLLNVNISHSDRMNLRASDIISCVWEVGVCVSERKVVLAILIV